MQGVGVNRNRNTVHSSAGASHLQLRQVCCELSASSGNAGEHYLRGRSASSARLQCLGMSRGGVPLCHAVVPCQASSRKVPVVIISYLIRWVQCLKQTTPIAPHGADEVLRKWQAA